MDINIKIGIKKAIEDNKDLAKRLNVKQPKEKDIKEFAYLSGTTDNFIILNLNQIKNWI